jgi:hypothetical protein
MGFLTDLGNVAVGAIERDREITKEDLAIRAENLQANRQILINQKQKKYDKELESFYKEKEKYDNINKMNTMFANNEIDKGTYASFALSSSIPNWDTLPKDKKTDLIDNFDGKTIDYKLSGSVEEINKKAAAAQTLINNETSAAIKDAKGNSFLINQILGRKETQEKDLYKAIESKLNAAEAVKMTEKGTENAGLDVKMDGSKGDLNWKKFKKNNPDWIKRYNGLKDKVVWDSVNKRDNFLNFIKTSDVLGAANEGNFTLTSNDTKIEGLNDSARAILKTYEMVYNSVVNDIYAKELAGNNVDITQIDNFISVAEVNKRVNNLIENRGFRVDLGDGIGDDGKVDFIGVVPLNVVDRNGGFELDSGATKYLNMQYVKDNYKSFLETEADKLIAESPKRFEEATNKKGAAMAIVQSSIENGGKYNLMFKNNLKVDRDDPNTPENENITQNPKVLADEKMANEGNSVGSVVKIVDDGKGNMVFRPNDKGKYKGIRIMKDGTGFKQKQPNGNWKKVSWQSVKDGNNVDKLSPLMKLKYDQWLSGNTEQAGTSVTSSNINSVDNDKIFSDMISEIEADITGKKKTRK